METLYYKALRGSLKKLVITTLTIRFAHEDIQRLQAEAVEQGVGPSTLARMLVKKGLRTL